METEHSEEEIVLPVQRSDAGANDKTSDEAALV